MKTWQPLTIGLLYFVGLAPGQRNVEAQAQASATPKIILKCTTSTGDPAANLEIDLAKKVMTWGVLHYSITAVTDRYISAYQLMHEEVGGETWVLDRTNGKYFRAGVGMFCDTSICEHQHLDTAVYRGVCSKGLF